MLSDVSQWTVHDGVTCEGVSEPPKLNIPLFKPREINEASATHIFYVNLAEKFQILPFIGSHESGVTCNGVSEPPMLNIPLFKPQEVSETSATHIIYVSLAEKFKILPFIGSHERGVTCKGVSEPPLLNIHLSVQHLGESTVLHQTVNHK